MINTPTERAADSLDTRVEALLSQLTLPEKVALLSGKDNWNTVPIERLGIPSLTMTDGPHGVRANSRESERMVGSATSFPTGVSMAASWDPDLIHRVAEALGEETLALGCDILLGPCVNIVRTPLAGRNFESYAEDPYLAGQIGTAYVKGLQSKGVGASLKHFACNNQEYERFRGNSVVDERTLREIYLAQFETIVKESQPWTVMCAYNRINGDYASENYHLLTEILRNEWGFEGIVVSDWTANHTIIESVKNGLDIEMPGPALYYGRALVAAVNNWQVEESVIDAAARRVLKMVLLSGRDTAARPEGTVNTPEHSALALELAEDSIVLLKNDNQLLPLKPTVNQIAVIGPNATNAIIGGGGSSYLEPPYRVSPLSALRAQLGQQAEIVYEQGCDNYVELPAIKTDYLHPAKGTGQGLWVEYFHNANFEGTPHLAALESKVEFWQFLPGSGTDTGSEQFSARWTGTLTVPTSGSHTFKLSNTDTARLYLDGKLVLESKGDETPKSGTSVYQNQSKQVQLTAGQPYALRVEFSRTTMGNFAHVKAMLGHILEHDNRLEQAVEAAKQADVAVLFVGQPEGFETEGVDRPNLQLPGRQNELIEAVAQVNPNMIVVLNTGAPAEMPWLDKVAAVIDAHYPGQEAGNAVTNVLTGKVNPSGKLTVTFPKRLQDTPAYNNYPGGRDVVYGEGIFVGYRHYDTRDIEPLFPFGYGLSYTTFGYGAIDAPAQIRIGDLVTVSVDVTNTGDVTGKEVVQLYVHEKRPAQQRPVKELKGFQKVELAPGETKTVQFTLNERAFASYFTDRHAWVVTPGEFDILIGSSSADIRATNTITLTR
jgi:beta-glucosidase